MKRAIRILMYVLVLISLSCYLIARSRSGFEFLGGKQPDLVIRLNGGKVIRIYYFNGDPGAFLTRAKTELDSRMLTPLSDPFGATWILHSRLVKINKGRWVFREADERTFTTMRAVADEGVTVTIESWDESETAWNRVTSLW